MPGARKHSIKWDRYVTHIRRRGRAADPYAVCTAALDELSRRKRKSNPLKVRDPAHRKILNQLKHHFASDEGQLRRMKSRRK